jgi:hypothetical protein
MRTHNTKGKVVSNYIILCKGVGHIIKGEMVKDGLYNHFHWLGHITNGKMVSNYIVLCNKGNMFF